MTGRAMAAATTAGSTATVTPEEIMVAAIPAEATAEEAMAAEEVVTSDGSLIVRVIYVRDV